MPHRLLVRLCLLSAAILWLEHAPASAQDSSFKSDHDTVLNDCAKAGGVFSEDSGGYGCNKGNCDGKGNSKDPHNCTVGCTNDDQCKGHTPDILVGNVTLLMLLQNGSNVNHSYATDAPTTPNHPGHDGGGCTLGAAC